MEKQFKVYIICPMTVPQVTLSTFATIVRKMGACVGYWNRGTNYSDQPLRQANAVVVLLPNNGWTHTIDGLPSGTRSEINLAKSLNIPIYLGYSSKTDNIPRVYCIDVSVRNRIEGLPGSSDNVAKTIRTYNDRYGSYPVVPEECGKPSIVYGTNGHPIDEGDDDEDEWSWAAVKATNPITKASYANIMEELKDLHYATMAKADVRSAIDLYKFDKRLLIQLL